MLFLTFSEFSLIHLLDVFIFSLINIKMTHTTLIIDTKHLLVSIRAFSFRFIIFCAIIICRIIKCSITSPYWTSSSLIIKMPIKTDKWLMLVAFMLQKRKTLIDTKFFQIPTITNFFIYQFSHSIPVQNLYISLSTYI